MFPIYRMFFAVQLELFAFKSVRLVDDVALLLVEWEPRDVYRTVSYGQLKLAKPHTRAVGENLHGVLSTARHEFLGTDIMQQYHHETVPTRRGPINYYEQQFL